MVATNYGFICPLCEVEMYPSFLFPKIGRGKCPNCGKIVTPPVPEELDSILDQIGEKYLEHTISTLDRYCMLIYGGKNYSFIVPGWFQPKAQELVDLGILAPFNKGLQLTQLGMYVIQHFREFVWRKKI